MITNYKNRDKDVLCCGVHNKSAEYESIVGLLVVEVMTIGRYILYIKFSLSFSTSVG